MRKRFQGFTGYSQTWGIRRLSLLRQRSFLKVPNRLYVDPVVAEIHAIREKMLADCDGDHQKLMQQVRVRQNASERKIILAPVHARSTEQGVAADGEQSVC